MKIVAALLLVASLAACSQWESPYDRKARLASGDTTCAGYVIERRGVIVTETLCAELIKTTRQGE